MIRKTFSNRHTLFWLIALTALVAFTLPVLIQDGMFMDAMLYTSVSHNLAQGYGTFWFPQFSEFKPGGFPSFHEQPPLVFGIQSLFFRVLGDSMYVERFYTFLTMCITAWLINRLWKSVYRHNEKWKPMGWLPILLWITIPVCFWSYSNNMHENTMGIFTLSAVLLIYNAYQKTGRTSSIQMILPGIFIFLATFSKGLPGFFPVTVPFIYWLTTKKIRFSKVMLHISILLAVPLLIYGILICFNDSRESLYMYFVKRALHRINQDPTADTRFFILASLFQDLLPLLLATAIAFLIARFKKIKVVPEGNKKLVWFFIGVGLAGSLPLMLTLVQKGFYYVPSMPFFAIGFAIFIAPVLIHFIDKINVEGKKYKAAVASGLLLFVAVITFSLLQAGKASRDKETLHDIYLIKTIVPQYSDISVPDKLWNDWGLQCYLMRYCNISIVTDHKTKFYFAQKEDPSDNLSGYKQVDIPTVRYDLYTKE